MSVVLVLVVVDVLLSHGLTETSVEGALSKLWLRLLLLVLLVEHNKVHINATNPQTKVPSKEMLLVEN